MHLEFVSQVHAPHWSGAGSGWSVTPATALPPVSGMGTTLALVGANVLAHELAAHTDPAGGFAA